jgi:DNA-binding protein YbaB
MDMFKMIKEAAAMKSKLSEMEKSLKAQVVEIESGGVKVKINAKSEILDIKLTPDFMKLDVAKAERSILSAVQAAEKKAQAVMMEEAKKITGGMKIPGLM